MEFILLNFSYGFGPFLRSLELAVKINDCYQLATGRRFGIIVPLIYGTKQKDIIRENFYLIIDKYPQEIIFDENLGNIIREVFYGFNDYEESLRILLNYGQKIEEKIFNYLSGNILAKDFNGKMVSLKRKDISFVLSRNPRLNFGISPSYYVSFGHTSEILEKFLEESNYKFDRNIFKKGVSFFSRLEKSYDQCYMSYPGSFSYLGDKYKRRYNNEVTVGPSISLPEKKPNIKDKGIYVTVSGIQNLDYLFKDIDKIGLKIYTNNPDVIDGGIKADPAVIFSDNIIIHFARSGWGSIWLSQLSSTPLIVPQYNETDDPEIFYNNKSVEFLGIGRVYRNDILSNLDNFIRDSKKNIINLNQRIINEFGSLSSVDYISESICKHYLKYDENNS